MSDFFQNGVITTLPILGDHPVEEMEAELRSYAAISKIALLLPALVTEFEGPAMKKILKQLQGVDYLHQVVVSLDRAERAQFVEIRDYLRRRLPAVQVVWHDGPRLQAIYQRLRGEDFPVDMPGKGQSVWMTMGYILAQGDVDGIALHDCDITNYERSLLARLVYPLMSRRADFEFCKGYYARVNGRLYGRATRLFFTPIIRSLKRTVGRLLYLEYLDSFRYPLAGEFAIHSHLAESVRIAPDWGLEISTLGEVYQNTSLKRICQVELMDSYCHKHQTIDIRKPSTGLVRMVMDISLSLFRILTQDGVVLSDAHFRSLQTSYLREAREAVDKYSALAAINRLEYDRHAEISAVEAFQKGFRLAVEQFREDPVGTPMIPAWTRVRSAIPDLSADLLAAVRADNA